jgi:hypothetical protein
LSQLGLHIETPPQTQTKNLFGLHLQVFRKNYSSLSTTKQFENNSEEEQINVFILSFILQEKQINASNI